MDAHSNKFKIFPVLDWTRTDKSGDMCMSITIHSQFIRQVGVNQTIMIMWYTCRMYDSCRSGLHCKLSRLKGVSEESVCFVFRILSSCGWPQRWFADGRNANHGTCNILWLVDIQRLVAHTSCPIHAEPAGHHTSTNGGNIKHMPTPHEKV